MSRYVEEIENAKRNYESSKKIEERNRKLLKENGNSSASSGSISL